MKKSSQDGSGTTSGEELVSVRNNRGYETGSGDHNITYLNVQSSVIDAQYIHNIQNNCQRNGKSGQEVGVGIMVSLRLDNESIGMK